MAVDTEKLEQALAEKGIVGWYLWRPNQVFTKDPSDPENYLSTDVMFDGSLADITQAANDAKDRQLAAIQQAGALKTSEINEQDVSYSQIKAICLQTFRSMRSYFVQQGMGIVVANIDSAIQRIDSLP